eukprot:CAMPEP_0184527034 /NCGR_PEP_ID=MMETSP0198_2-20121128/10980_1 /TAXON_ID=1112570 /ORGANISM="Thraustochytrium sp., Strain LLF1b" /LENGTH=598 /DNA_ID=CAMNT_0026918661 /DNA_START=1228 /DNA_END=3024 /DNA_ORIENTATION=+
MAPQTATSAAAAPKAKKRPAGPRHWTPEEDKALKSAVDQYGARQWKLIAQFVPTRTHTQCLQRWNKVLKPGLLKGPWSPEEDRLLRALVEQGMASLSEAESDEKKLVSRRSEGSMSTTSDWSDAGSTDTARDARIKRVDWFLISENIPGRSVKQCRERWCCNLDPKINKGAWTEEEDRILIDVQAREGNCWAKIARLLNGRTEHTVKTRFRSILRARRREWSAEEDQALLSAWEEHRNDWKAIVEAIGGKRSKSAMMSRLKQLQSKSATPASNLSKSVVPKSLRPTAPTQDPAPFPTELHQNIGGREFSRSSPELEKFPNLEQFDEDLITSSAVNTQSGEHLEVQDAVSDLKLGASHKSEEINPEAPPPLQVQQQPFAPQRVQPTQPWTLQPPLLFSSNQGSMPQLQPQEAHYSTAQQPNMTALNSRSTFGPSPGLTLGDGLLSQPFDSHRLLRRLTSETQLSNFSYSPVLTAAVSGLGSHEERQTKRRNLLKRYSDSCGGEINETSKDMLLDLIDFSELDTEIMDTKNTNLSGTTTFAPHTNMHNDKALQSTSGTNGSMLNQQQGSCSGAVSNSRLKHRGSSHQILQALDILTSATC